MRTERRVEQYLYERKTVTRKGEVKRRYLATFTDWKGIPRKFAAGATLGEARAQLAVLRMRNAGRFDFDADKRTRERERATLGEWIEHYKGAKAAKRDLAKEILRFNVILGYFGNRPLHAITSTDLEKFRTWLLQTPQGEGRAPRTKSTANRYLQLLTAVLGMAGDAGKLAKVPRLRRFKEPNGRDRTLTDGEYQCLYDACVDYLRNLVVCAWETGMRQGEIIRLKRTSVNLRAGFIRLEPKDTKTEQGRDVPISPTLRALLVKCMSIVNVRKGGKVEEVFLRDGKPMEVFPRTAWENARKRADLLDLRFHDLRHCFITRKVRAGYPQKWIMAITGHKTAAVFNRYNNPGSEDLLSVVGASTSLFPSASPRGNQAGGEACASDVTAVNSRS